VVVVTGEKKRQKTAEAIERGARLCALRELFGLTQDQVAERGGFKDRTQVTLAETGWNASSTRGSQEKLARAFQLWPETIADLLDGQISPSQAHARAGESLLERPATPVTRSARLRDRPEWSTVLPQAQVTMTTIHGAVPAASWETLGEVLDSAPFPRPLTVGFLVNLAQALRAP